MCPVHYARHRTGATVNAPVGEYRSRSGSCSVATCVRPIKTAGLCGMHYNRQILKGDTGQADPLKAANGSRKRWVDPRSGYAYVYVPGGRGRLEHRAVMEGHLGRKLQPFEEVHHLNGRRADNEVSNLELWTKPQPAGQRPEDLVAWVLDNYVDLVESELKTRKREAHTGQLKLVESI